MTLVEMRENWSSAIDALKSHKMRSSLTMLGIVIGVTSVIAVAAIIEGLNKTVQNRVQLIGSRTFFITRVPFGINVLRLPQKIRIRKYIQATDSQYLQTSCPLIEFATVFGNRPSFTDGFKAGEANDIRFENENVQRVIVRGVEPDFDRAMPLFSVAQGRFISRFDLEHSPYVVVLGSAIAESLFSHTDPIGKSVRLNGKMYQVIGIFEKDPGLFGRPGVDQFACIPFTTFRKEYPEVRELIIAFAVPDNVRLDRAVDEVTEAMRRRRGVTRSDNDFEINSPDFLAKLWDDLTSALFILTVLISSVGLVVGGIGVMNIMLISVTERTKEIGVRKALGARRSDIKVQFLMEAVMLTLIGGVIGIALGATLAALVRHFVPSVPATLSVFWIALGVAMSVVAGVFFGYYPAKRAASLDPIVCLRYE